MHITRYPVSSESPESPEPSVPQNVVISSNSQLFSKGLSRVKKIRKLSDVRALFTDVYHAFARNKCVTSISLWSFVLFLGYMVLGIICTLFHNVYGMIIADTLVIVLFAFLVLANTAMGHGPVLEDDIYPDTDGYDALISVLVGVFTLAITCGVGGWMANKVDYEARVASQNNLEQMGMWAFLFVLIVAPVAEELIFRNALLKPVFERYATPSRTLVWVTWGLSAVLFAVLHGTWSKMVYALALGLFLCSLRQLYYRLTLFSLGLVMFAHIIYNFANSMFVQMFYGASSRDITMFALIAFAILGCYEYMVANKYPKHEVALPRIAW